MDPNKAAQLSAIAAVISGLIALAALVVAIVTTKAGKDAAKAAMRSAETAERALAMATQVRWRLTKLDGESGGYLLGNVGGGVAYGVELRGASINVPDSQPRDAVGPNESITIYSAISYGDKEFMLIVDWHDDPDLAGTLQTWRHTLLY